MTKLPLFGIPNDLFGQCSANIPDYGFKIFKICRPLKVSQNSRLMLYIFSKIRYQEDKWVKLSTFFR